MPDFVQELETGPRPPINKGAIQVYDHRYKRVYIYGGTRWADNEDIGSPTTEPTADFFCINILTTLKWQNYTESMREDNSLASPFKDEASLPEPHGLDLPRLGSLPALQDPIGAVVYDETAAKHTYILILGDPIDPKHNHPVLLCINITLNSWRRIRLRNTKKVPDGRARGSMVIVGELRSNSDIFLCVFGGVMERVVDETNVIESLDTYAIANLTKEIWIIPNGKIPSSIGPLGVRPGLQVFYNEDKRFKVLILRGAVEDELHNTEESAQAIFSKAFMFDPQASSSSARSFAEIPLQCPTKFPRSAKMYTLQAALSKDPRHSPISFLMMTCHGTQRALNAIPPKAGDHEKINEFYIKPDIKLWVAELRAPQTAHSYESNEAQSDARASDSDDNESSREGDSDDSDSSDSSDSSIDEPYQTSILSQRAKKSGPSIIRTQRAKRTSEPALPKTEITLEWHSIHAGRVKKNLESISDSFRVEAACLIGDVDLYNEPAYAKIHPLSPRLVLLGCEYEYLGEVLGDVYNAVTSIPLDSLLEADEELICRLEDDRIPESRSGSSTPELNKVDDEDILMMSPTSARRPELTIPADEFADLDETLAGALQNAENDAGFIPPGSDFEPLDVSDQEAEEVESSRHSPPSD